MDWNVVVLVLGILTLAFAAYFAHAVIRPSGGSVEAALGRNEMRFKVSSEQRTLVVGDVRAARR